MNSKRLHVSILVALLVLTVITRIAIPGEAQGATVYRYVNKDGSIVFTDNPPPGVKAEISGSFREMSKEEKLEWEKEQGAKMEKYREEERQKLAREKEIGPAREDYESAKLTLQQYKVNMNRAASDQYSRWLNWKKKVEEQEKVVAKKKEILDALESKP